MSIIRIIDEEEVVDSYVFADEGITEAIEKAYSGWSRREQLDIARAISKEQIRLFLAGHRHEARISALQDAQQVVAGDDDIDAVRERSSTQANLIRELDALIREEVLAYDKHKQEVLGREY